MEDEVFELVRKWKREDECEETEEHLSGLLRENRIKLLSELMEPLIKLGKGGIRGIVGPGYARLNAQNVQRLAQAFCSTIDEDAGVVFVGYDHREHSKMFAGIICRTVLEYTRRRRKDITAELFPHTIPKHLVPFACKNSEAICKKKCVGGFMVTGSHKPRNYNGVKVYNGTGCHLRGEQEKQAWLKMKELVPTENSVFLWELRDTDILSGDSFGATLELYRKELNRIFKKMPKHKVDAVYTPHHGVCQRYVDMATDCLGLKRVTRVPSQWKEDPLFPTTIFHNIPENDLKSLADAKRTADKEKIPVVFATDPDGDLFCVAERNSEGWYTFNENEIAVIALHYLLEKKGRTKQPNMLVVPYTTSFLLGEIARVNGVVYYETELGFSEIGFGVRRQNENNMNVLLAIGGSFGFLVGNHVWEKDGIAAMCLFYILLGELSLAKKTLGEYLEEALKKYPKIKTRGFYYVGKERRDVENVITRLKEMIDKKTAFMLGEVTLRAKYTNESIIVFNGKKRKIVLRSTFLNPRIKVLVDFLDDDPMEEVIAFCEEILDVEKNKLTRKMFSI
ncbi:MAG: phosphoglucomutase [Amphiamblys sp. WSBS2006]|nr:MAG: phosphoglucomutase [Amphiamblys sp. WSBS2006]